MPDGRACRRLYRTGSWRQCLRIRACFSQGPPPLGLRTSERQQGRFPACANYTPKAKRELRAEVRAEKVGPADPKVKTQKQNPPLQAAEDRSLRVGMTSYLSRDLNKQVPLKV